MTLKYFIYSRYLPALVWANTVQTYYEVLNLTTFTPRTRAEISRAPENAEHKPIKLAGKQKCPI